MQDFAPAGEHYPHASKSVNIRLDLIGSVLNLHSIASILLKLIKGIFFEVPLAAWAMYFSGPE